MNDEATAYHEGIPGHHMQVSVAQEMTGLPKFRQHNFNSGYIEGWALYSEQLGKEVGFYQDPVSDYGRLASERFRAVRLVVDTGIHSKGWTREQVVDYFRKSGTIDEPDDPVRNRPLHCVAGASPELQAGTDQIPRTPRTGTEGTGAEI